MSSLDHLEWSECGESFEDILTNPRVNLPQLIRLSSSVTSVNGESLQAGQVILIHERKTVTKLFATDEKGNELYLPTQCPFSVIQKLLPGNEKHFNSILDVANADPLPKFVEVTRISGLEAVKVGDRLKVVIVEKSGSSPSFIHFRGPTGKHVKIPVSQDISFKLAVNDTSEKLLSDLAAKSLELPVIVEFDCNRDIPKTHTNLGIINITKGFTENIVLSSAKVGSIEYVFVFPLNAQFKFQVNSKLKLAKDEPYRELCMSFSSIDTDAVMNFLNIVDPHIKDSTYIIQYKKLLKLLKIDTDENEVEEQINSSSTINTHSETTKSSAHSHQITNTYLQQDTQQQEIIKKEKERKQKIEKENQKAEIKKLKKEKKEKEKEEKKKKKAIRSTSAKDLVIEKVDEDMYIFPENQGSQNKTLCSPHRQSVSALSDTDQISDSHSQWSFSLKKSFNFFRDRTKSGGPLHRKKIVKKDNEISNSHENVEMYTTLVPESFYETTEMAYESLDLFKHMQQALAPAIPPVENSGDSGFDELDQAKIEAWRKTMMPPPLPGNHPLHNRTLLVNEDIYEEAIDNKKNDTNLVDVQKSWTQFYNIVEQSAKEISTWSMQDVTDCLKDLNLAKHTNVFNDSMVDGQLLLDLDESVLRELGLDLFEARKLRKFVFGWRPDIIRPVNYPVLKGFTSDDPSEWSETDVINHLKVIEINDFADFCHRNQVNGDLLKDICIDDLIMNSILSTKDKKIKILKIKNYVIDKWRPKKTGEGNYVTSSLRKSNQSQSLSFDEPMCSSTNISPKIESHSNQKSSTLRLAKKSVADAPLVAKMKMQLEEKQSDWHNRKKIESTS